METTIADSAPGDMVRLSSEEEYQKYFSHMTHVFKCLLLWYDKIEGAVHEKEMISGFMERILSTITALGVKYTYRTSDSLMLDLIDSGYPHYLGIMELENDVQNREKMLKKLLPCPILKEKMVDWMLKKAEEPKELLDQMSSRQYFQDLKESSLVFSFTPGDFILLEESEKMRRYLFSWLCYDSESSVPHIHLMVFDQDKVDAPIHEEGVDRMQFIDVIRKYGNRVPDMLVLAADIDGALEHVHPKVLKRIKLGPILSNAYSKETMEMNPFLRPLSEYGDGGDFILLVRNEMLFSKSQTDGKKPGFGFLKSFGAKKIREVFAVNRQDDECAQTNASQIDRQVLLPHHVIQHIDFTDPAFEKYRDAGKIVYDKHEVFVIE